MPAYLQFTGKQLAGILGDLRSVIAPKTSFPALSNVLIENVGEGRVRFTATDLDHTLQIEAAHDGLFAGKCCVPLDKLLGLARAFKDEDLTLTPQDGGWSEVRSERGKYRLAGITPDNFPQLPTAEAQSYEVRAEDLFFALSEVALHVGREEDEQHALRSTLLTLNGSLRCVATSGRSMGVCDVKSEQPFLTGGVASWLIPTKAVSAIRAAFEPTGTILCWASDSLLCFRQGNKLLTSRRPEAKFPDYEMVLSLLATEEIEVDKEGLTRALDALTGFAPTEEGQYNSYKTATLSFSPHGLTVKTVSQAGEECVEEVDAKSSQEFNAKMEVHLLRSMFRQAGADAKLYAVPDKPWALISESERHKTVQSTLPLVR